MGEPQYRLEGIVHTKSDVLEDFEGPLDVIFELLSKNKIEIQDVSISAILEQYLGYLDEMKRMDMEIASEFITMASHLMLIKTKMLLSAAEQAEAESELDLLRQSLVERKRKEAMEQIRQAVTVHQGAGASAQRAGIPLSARRDRLASGAGHHRRAQSAPVAPAHGKFPGHRGQGAVPHRPENRRGAASAAAAGRRAIKESVPGQPEPLRGRSHVSCHSGFV